MDVPHDDLRTRLTDVIAVAERALNRHPDWQQLGALASQQAAYGSLSQEERAAKAALEVRLAANPLFSVRRKLQEALSLLAEPEHAEQFEPASPPCLLAAAEPTELQRPTRIADKVTGLPKSPQDANGSIVVHAAPPVPMPPPGGAPSAPPDDLTSIRYIEQQIAAGLARLGVTTWAQIANFSASDVRLVSAALRLGRRINTENWIEHAALLKQRQGRAVTTAFQGSGALRVVTDATAAVSQPDLVAAASERILSQIRAIQPERASAASVPPVAPAKTETTAPAPSKSPPIEPAFVEPAVPVATIAAAADEAEVAVVAPQLPPAVPASPEPALPIPSNVETPAQTYFSAAIKPEEAEVVIVARDVYVSRHASTEYQRGSAGSTARPFETLTPPAATAVGGAERGFTGFFFKVEDASVEIFTGDDPPGRVKR